MSGPLPLRKGLLLIAAIAIVAGCSGANPTKKPVPSPAVAANQLVAQSVSKMQDVKTFHMHVDVKGVARGEIAKSMGLAEGAEAKLDGTTVDMDVDGTDKANPKMHVAFSAPSIFGLSADAILVDGYLYYKTSMTGTKYTKIKSDSAQGMAGDQVPVTPDQVEQQMGDLQSSLDQIGQAKYIGVDQVDGKDAYHVQIDVPKEKLAEAAAAEASGMTIDSASVDAWVYVSDSRLAKLELKASSGDSGNIDIVLTLTKYGQAIPAVKAPAADQIQAGS